MIWIEHLRIIMKAVLSEIDSCSSIEILPTLVKSVRATIKPSTLHKVEARMLTHVVECQAQMGEHNGW